MGGSIIKLVMKLQHLSYDDAVSVINTFSKRGQLERRHDTPKEKHEFHLPLGTSDELTDHHKDYLINRDFDPVLIQQKYGIKAVGPISSRGFANRILIPYFYGNQIVTYTARDITDSDRERYRTCPKDTAIINVDHILYNIQTIRDIAVIVEGPTDVWRMGDHFVAMGSLVWNSKRLILLKQCKQVFVWPDFGNKEKLIWSELAYSLSTIVPDVRFIEIDEGDPGDLDETTVRNFRREIFGRKY